MNKKMRENIARYSNLLYQRGLVGAAGGNVSMRSGSQVLITAGGKSLRDISADEVLTVDLDGSLMEKAAGLKPSKEISLHTNVYRAREDIDSVIHVHPIYATVFAVKGEAVPMVTASSRLKLIEVPLVKYADPGSKELAELVYQNVSGAPAGISAILLESHGLIAFSRGLDNCFNIAELVEETAKIACISRQMDG